jgi:hypothetical protein
MSWRAFVNTESAGGAEDECTEENSELLVALDEAIKDAEAAPLSRYLRKGCPLGSHEMDFNRSLNGGKTEKTELVPSISVVCHYLLSGLSRHNLSCDRR